MIRFSIHPSSILQPSILLILSALTVPRVLSAQAPFVGPRSAGMAGASVAVADDGTALWTNPAGFARDPRLDVDLFAGGVASNRNGFTAIVDELSSIDFSRLDPAGIAAGVADLRRLAPAGTGIVASGVAGLVVGKWGWALGIGDLAFSGVYPDVDLVHVLPGNDPATGFVHNQSGIAFSGLEAREARLAYSRPFFEKVLLVGATLRYIRGTTYFTRGSLFDEGSSDPVALARKALRENPLETTRFTFDVGGMVNILGKARVGLVSTAINEPEFDVKHDPADPTLAGAPATIRIPRTLRIGAAGEPIGALTVAADYDLRETDTLVPGGRSRQFCLGAEFRFPLFAVRAGTFYDGGAPDPHWAYSAGFGLGLNKVSLNAAFVFSSEGGLSLSSTNRRDVGAALDARVRF